MNAPTAHTTANTNEAQFLAPETHQRANVKRIRVGDFRDAVDTLNWNRNDLSGATRDEFARMDVASRLQRHIAIVVDLILRLPQRYAEDLRHARASIEAAEKVIARWRTLQPTAQVPVQASTVSAKPEAPEWMAEILAKRDARLFRARVLADNAEFPECGGGSVRFIHAEDPTRHGIAGPCMSKPGRFRFTHFDAHGPVGDLGFTSLVETIDEALSMHYEPVPCGAPDPAGLPVAAPVQMNIRLLPVPVQCAIEWFGTVPSQERTRERLSSLLDHYLATYGKSGDELRPFYLDSACAIARRRYLIDADTFGSTGARA